MVNRKSAVKLQPLGQWIIDYGDNNCRLSRLFGSADQPHLVMIEQAAPSGQFGLTLAGKGIRNFRKGTWTYLGLLNDVPMKPLQGSMRGSVDKIGPAIILSSVFISERAREDIDASFSKATGIGIGQAGKIDRVVLRLGSTVMSFETGNLEDAMVAMNTCTTNLLESWSLSAKEHRAYAPPKWLNMDDVVRRIVTNYPAAALYRGEQAILRLRVIVETDGSVSTCHLENSTETERLVSPACTEMLEARFEPARNAADKPMRSYYATTVRYVL